MVKQYVEPVPANVQPIAIKRERPFALKAVCALLMFEGLILLGVVILSFFLVFTKGETVTEVVPFMDLVNGVSALTELILIGVAGAVLVWVAQGLWRFNPWAWRWTMITMGVFLVINLWNYFRMNQAWTSTLSLVIDILIVFYLVQPEVRRLYIDKPKDGDIPDAS